jgi:hypothetical protein
VTFAWKETIKGLKHLRLRVERSLLGQPIDFYLSPQAEKGLARPVCLDGSKIEVCQVCGFALARVTLPGEWTLETCSASGLKHVLNNDRLSEWSKSLPRSVSSVGSLPGSKV